MILMYHNLVGGNTLPGYKMQAINLKVDAFVKQVKWLKLLGFHIVDYKTYRESPRKKNILITFDDGTYETYRLLTKVLETSPIPVTIFVNSCQLEDGPLIWGAYLNALCFDEQYSSIVYDEKTFPLGSNQEKQEARRYLTQHFKQFELPHLAIAALREKYPISPRVKAHYKGMSYDQLNHAGKSKWITIGGHTHNHPFLSAQSPKNQFDEINSNLEILQSKTGEKVKQFAYPSGDYNTKTIEILKELGIEEGFAVQPKGIGTEKNYEISREGIYDSSVIKLIAKILLK